VSLPERQPRPDQQHGDKSGGHDGNRTNALRSPPRLALPDGVRVGSFPKLLETLSRLAL
jgi:hypothetical protein